MESKEDVLKRIVGLERFESQVMFYDDALQAMTEYAAPLHARISELEAEVKSANERIQKASTILVEDHGFSKTGILYKILNP